MRLAFHVSMLEPTTVAIACYAVSKVDRRLLRRPQKMCLWCRRHHDELLRSVLDEVAEPMLDHLHNAALPGGLTSLLLCSLFIVIILLC